VTLLAPVLGRVLEVVVSNFDLATSRAQERAGVEHNFDRVETIDLEDPACDPARTAAASNGNRAMACDPIVPTVVPTAPIVDPVIAGLI
jgi:hypothetical protein